MPDSFKSEMTRVGGSFPRFVLGIDYDGTLKYYSDVTIGTSELNATGNITDWGQLQLQATPGAVGGHQNISLTLADPDLTLMDEFTDWPGIQTRACYVYQYYDPAPTGGGWADRITLFKGVVGPGVKFDEKTATWKLSLVDIGKKRNPTIGVHFSRQVFPEMNCSTCGDDAIIPIAYGDPVKGVRGCVIHRPGRGIMCQAPCTPGGWDYNIAQCDLHVPDLWFVICADQMSQFTPGEQCVVLVDSRGATYGIERVCGRLHNNGLFEIYDINNYSNFSWDAGSQRDARSSWVATGRGSYYVTGGVKYLTVPKSAFADWTRGGYGYQGNINVIVNCGGEWKALVANVWASVSGSHVAFHNTGGGPGDYTDPCPNNNFEFIAVQFTNWTSGVSYGWAGKTWSTGSTEVVAGDPFVYAVNFLPSEEVEAVYYNQGKWGFLNPANWTANLNDKSYNVALKRDPSDDGITTVTLHTWWEVYNPLYARPGQGNTLDSIHANLKGIVGHADHRAYDGDALKHPVDVIEDYLTNPFLGNTPYSMIDTASFDEAKDRIDDLTQDIAPTYAPQGLRFAFAQYEPQELNGHILKELSLQGTMLFYWDMGMATLRAIFPNWLQSDTVFEVNESNQRDDTFGFDLIDIEKSPTELVGLFTAWSWLYANWQVYSQRGIEQRIIRRSSEAELFRPRKSQSVKLTAYQEVYSVNYVLETWLRDRLNTSANVTVTLYLDAMHLQPGDIIDIQRQSGAPKVLLHKLARVESATQNIGDSRNGEPGLIKAKSQIRLTDFAIDAAQFIEQDCDESVNAPGVTTAPPMPGPATTTVLPTSTTVTLPPATTMGPTTTVNPVPPTTVTTTTTTPPTCTASGNCAWRYDPSLIVSGNPCWPFVLIDSDCGIGEFCYPIYSGGNASGCPSGNPGFLQCLNTPCQTVTTIAPATTTSTSTTLTTPSPNCSTYPDCCWMWIGNTNGMGFYAAVDWPPYGNDRCYDRSGCDCNFTPPTAYVGVQWCMPCGSGWATTTSAPATTTTTPPTSTTATTQMACLGQCVWLWQGAPNQQGNGWYGSWTLQSNTCQGDTACGCCEPVALGGNVPVGQPSFNPDQTRPGSMIYTPCQTMDCEDLGTTSAPATSTTTTVPPVTTPAATTTVTTSVTTAPPTTTTTVPPAGTCDGHCTYIWQEGSCAGRCWYRWQRDGAGQFRWVDVGNQCQSGASGGASCECNPYDPVAIDPSDPTAGGARSVVDGTPENIIWLSRCTCVGVADDQPNNQGGCSGGYVLLKALCGGTDEYCKCPNPPTSKGDNLHRVACVSWATTTEGPTTTSTTTSTTTTSTTTTTGGPTTTGTTTSTTTSTTTTTTTAAPDPCFGVSCGEAGCAGFTWSAGSPDHYELAAFYCESGFTPGIPPTTNQGQLWIGCCVPS